MADASSRARPLGALERAVMEALWSGGRADVKAVHRSVGVPRGVTPNTIQSTLERLVRKGLAARHRAGRAYEYAPRLSKQAWVTRSLEELARASGGSSRLLAAAFVDMTERAGDERLEELESLVRARRRVRRRDAP